MNTPATNSGEKNTLDQTRGCIAIRYSLLATRNERLARDLRGGAFVVPLAGLFDGSALAAGSLTRFARPLIPGL